MTIEWILSMWIFDIGVQEWELARYKSQEDCLNSMIAVAHGQIGKLGNPIKVEREETNAISLFWDDFKTARYIKCDMEAVPEIKLPF